MFSTRPFLGLLLLSISSLPIVGLAVPTDNDDVVHKMEQAQAQQRQGHNDEARKIYGSLLLKLRAGPPSRQLGDVLEHLSEIDVGDGNYSAAVSSAQEAVEVYRTLDDADGQAHALNDKGIAEIENGLYGPAQRDLELAWQLARATPGRRIETQVLNSLGSAFYFQGKYLEAMRSYQDAMHILDQSSAETWSGYWRQITSFNEATLYQRLGRYETALKIYQQLETSSGKFTPDDRAHLLVNLGALYRRLGDPWEALSTYRSAQNIYARVHDADGRISVLKNIGIVHALDLDDLVRARQIFEQARELANRTKNRREEMQAHLYLGETMLRQNLLQSAQRELEAAWDLTVTLGTTEEQWKVLYGLGRIAERHGGRTEAESKYRQAITLIEQSRASLQLSALRADFFADKREVFDSLIRLLVLKNETSETFYMLERSRARTFQDRITANIDGKPEVAPTLAEVQSRLSSDSMLVELWTASDEVAVVWCTATASGVVYRALKPSERRLVQSYLDRLPNGLGSSWRSDGAVLSTVLPDLSKIWKDARHLLIVPDGWFSMLPFELLPSGKNKLLIEEHDITYLPSAVLLRRKQHKDVLNFPWQKELIAFGDPLIGNGPEIATEALGRGPNHALPGSGDEVRSIARMCRGQNQIFLGQSDLKRELFSRANSGRLLHISTHSFADGDNPENSRMVFSPEQPGGEKDYVFLREIYSLDLRTISLATISACDTEHGKVIRGEGAEAFSRAFLAAGAESSLTTLWQVDDAATSEFMKQFYFYALEQHQPKAEALRLAKLKFLASGSQLQDPRFWAAFVLNGEGLVPLPRFISWTKLMAAPLSTLAATVLLVVLALGSRRKLHRKHNARSIVAH